MIDLVILNLKDVQSRSCFQPIIKMMKKRQISYDNLAAVLATAYSVHLNTQKFHWNIIGNDFYSLHKFSETLYEELGEYIDQIAERIRAIDYFAPASYAEFQKLTKVKDTINLGTTVGEATMSLFKDWRALTDSIADAVTAINETDDEGTISFLTDLLHKHEKMCWMIKSHL